MSATRVHRDAVSNVGDKVLIEIRDTLEAIHGDLNLVARNARLQAEILQLKERAERLEQQTEALERLLKT